MFRLTLRPVILRAPTTATSSRLLARCYASPPSSSSSDSPPSSSLPPSKTFQPGKNSQDGEEWEQPASHRHVGFSSLSSHESSSKSVLRNLQAELENINATEHAESAAKAARAQEELEPEELSEQELDDYVNEALQEIEEELLYEDAGLGQVDLHAEEGSVESVEQALAKQESGEEIAEEYDSEDEEISDEAAAYLAAAEAEEASLTSGDRGDFSDEESDLEEFDGDNGYVVHDERPLMSGIETPSLPTLDADEDEIELPPLPPPKPRPLPFINLPLAEDPLLHKIASQIMTDGKRTQATRIVSRTLQIIHAQTRVPALPVVREAIFAIMPSVRVKKFKSRGRAGGGKEMFVPMTLSEKQATFTAIRDLLRKVNDTRKGGKWLEERLAKEIISIVQGKSGLLEGKASVHKLAVTNRGSIKGGRKN